VAQLSPGASGVSPDTYPPNASEIDDVYLDLSVRDPSIAIATDIGRPDAPAVRRPRAKAGPAAWTAVVDAALAVAIALMGLAVGALPAIAVAVAPFAWVGSLLAFGARGAARPAVALRPVAGAASLVGFALLLTGWASAGAVLAIAAALVASGVAVRGISTRIGRDEGRRLRTAVIDAGAAADGALNGAADITPVVMIELPEPLLRDGRRHHAIPTVEGGVEAIPRILDDHEIECLLVMGVLPNPQLEALRRAARRASVTFRVAVPIPAMPARTLTAVSSDGAAMITVSRPITRVEAALKRTIDVTIAALLLAVSSPLLLMIAIAIKMSSPGPVTFRQWRVTQGGRRFRIVKFRTMDASRAPSAGSSTAQPFFKLEDDPRLTPIGRIIRRASLDELPQLWNVIRGDMSLVGPRPLPVEQVEAHPELLGPRNDVRAGLTGWWQVNGRSDLHVEEAVGHDLFYIENWSLSFDLRILAKTLPAIFSRRGAY